MATVGDASIVSHARDKCHEGLGGVIVAGNVFIYHWVASDYILLLAFVELKACLSRVGNAQG